MRRFLIIMTPEFITKWNALDEEEQQKVVQAIPPAELLKAVISSEITLHDLISMPEEAFEAIPQVAMARTFVHGFLPMAYRRMGELITR